MAKTTTKQPKETESVLPKAKRGRTMLGGKVTEVQIKPLLINAARRPDGKVFAEAVVVYGRMNPPTIGHQKLIEAAQMIAEHSDGVPMLFLSQTVNKKNPLNYQEKLELAEVAFGDTIHVITEVVADPIDLLKKISEDFANITLVTGSDGAKDFTRILREYNGKDFTFESAEVVTVDRDFDSEDLDESISASAMRLCVMDGDLESFKQGLPDALKEYSAEIFNQVKFGLNIQNITEETTLDKARKAIVNLRNRT